MREWFVTTVRPRHERAVTQQLAVRGLEPFSPSYPLARRWSDRNITLTQPLFPGYVFCRFSRRERPHVLKTPGITSVVGFGGQPLPVPESELDRIRAMIASGKGLEPWSYLRTGNKVRVETGPLKGIEGLIVQIKQDLRLVVSVTLLQRSVSVLIDRDQIVPIQ